MVNFVTQLSKYLVLFSILIYTYLGFVYFRYRTPRKQSQTLNIMFGLMVFMHLINYLVIYVNTENLNIFILYGVELGLIIFLSIIYHWIYPEINELVFQHMMMLLTIGMTFLARISYKITVRHVAFIWAGVLLCLLVPIIIEKFTKLIHISYFLAAAGILLLAFVLVFGKTKNGAKNWIMIGSFGLQPSEFVKLLFVFAMAGLLSRAEKFKEIVIISSIAAAHVLLLVLEKDLGGALIFFLTYVFMLTVATGKFAYMFAGFGAGSIAAVIAYKLFSHVRVRVLAWSDPWSDIANRGYQISQSLFAIGTGGWLGMGLTKGLPNVIPVVSTDFIFSGIAEEMGGIYAICLILICMSCFIMFINIAMRLQDLYYKLIALGFGVMYGIQVFLNIGGVIKMIPSTGVTLPLVSTGGTSMLVTLIMFNIVQGLYLLNEKQRKANTMNAYESRVKNAKR